MPTIFKVLLLAVVYYIAAKFGSLFTVPPYYSAIVWPGAGIALATLIVFGQRYWTGVLLGALAVNIQHSFVIDLNSLVISFVIATGASLQAVVACYLCNRFIRFPNVLEETLTLLKLFFLGGVIACAISATVGTATLYVAGIVLSRDLLGHWFFWWLGDVTGVVAFAPAVLLLLTARTKNIKISCNRRWVVTLVTLLAFFATGSVYSLAQKLRQSDTQLNFDNRVASVGSGFESVLSAYENVLVANDQYLIASEYVSSQEFETFTSKFLALYPSIHALSWNPKVSRDERGQFEATIRQQGFKEFQILDRVAQGEMAKAGLRDQYFPIGYIYPYEKNKGAHGFDVYGPDPLAPGIRKALLDRAKAENKSFSTGKISIVQAENSFGLLVYHPVFEASGSANSSLLGYTAGVFIVPSMMEPVRERAKLANTHILLFDITDGEKEFLYDSRFPEAKTISQPLEEYVGLKTLRSVPFAGRVFQVVFIDAAAGSRQFSWLVAVSSVGVLLFLGLFSILVCALTAQNDVVQRLVIEKTHELEEANTELEEFAYRTSHDLRSPLVSSIGLLKYIGREIPQDNERLGQSVSVAQGSLEKLEALVGDILDLTRTRKITEDLQEIDAALVISESLEKLEFMEGFKAMRFEKSCAFDKTFMGQPNKFRHVIENLISNAIKYRDVDENLSLVQLSTYEKQGDFVFEITDNGIGIPKDKQDNLFAMFHRFHPRVSYGSGLGLYMVDKTVRAMGGKIEFEDVGNGSKFIVSLPV